MSLPLSSSLPDELSAALKIAQPLVVLVSLDGCPFCKMARENYLNPLREQDGLPVVQVDMNSAKKLTNFDGKTLTHGDLIRRWKIKLAPTVLFFGRDGAEVAERMVGAYIADFYGAYLDQRLAQARLAIRG
jgi:thioredoxin-related protein